MDDFRNKRVTVAGLGRFGGGISVARWLVEQGASVLVTDQAAAEKLKDSVAQLQGLPITYRLGEHRTADFTDTDLVVASPAIPLGNEYLKAARDAGVPITTEMRLFVERLPEGVITVGVTGTKGKSTTTAMLGLMLKTRHTVHLGGNIGKSLLADLPNIRAGEVVLLELSSFMLEHLRPLGWSPHVAVYTMISEDHLDWHGGLEGYLAAKRILCEFQAPTDYVVYSPSNAPALEMALSGDGARVPYATPDARAFELKLPGAHNQFNAQGAFAAAACLGVTFEDAQRAVRDFPGLPHRLQLVHESGDGVRYYNDSIATIPEAAVAALNAFPPKTVLQVIGGYDKHLDRAGLIAALNGRAKAVLCIGATGPAVARELAAVRGAGSPEVHDCGDLANAMSVAKRLAKPGDNVVLSTGFASYDQFTNFEQRGNAFAELARQQ